MKLVGWRAAYFFATEPGGKQRLGPSGPKIGERRHKPCRDGLRETDIVGRRLADERHANSDRNFPKKFFAKETAVAQFHLTGMPHEAAREGPDQRRDSTAEDRIDRIDKSTIVHARSSSSATTRAVSSFTASIRRPVILP